MAVASDPAFKRNVARIAFNTLKWGRDHVPPGVRSLIGALLMVGGVFGFLPILGFWMFPLGLAFAALDFPPARRELDTPKVRQQRGAAGS
ncbi:MAG: hypothetical protein F4171_05465 [Gammaproteobacteria bacterium]|nr:hypothetical protein [Gammaproteobacteria bacterium]